ncbi:hypothetical protein Taro_054426 [Colocasia esculenta]|uniref:R13L1/DRL21-like LRR repeat region domain-containing protein n=1 Tax=Colocasia esculenta TaxID=4460 RepID=A0A843XR59_COLES|nr:hypothetical protein [Colocasia esculenta]
MPGFQVSPKHNHAKLGELKDMNNIRGVFAISGLENLADVSEAKKACLDKKRNISFLHLEWDPRAASSSIDEEVLESLKPSVKLVGLQISGFKGPSYPSWLVDQSFFRLGTIELELCEKWISLPPLGQLPSLKLLYISNARAVEYIGREFFSGGFPRLEELTLGSLNNWKSWCGAQERDCPKLKKLSIERCGNLESFSLINLGALEDMSISRCPKLRCVPGQSLELSHLPCGDCNLYLVFRNVHDASEAASNFCHDASEAASNSRPKVYREVRIWEIEWDCCTNDRSNFVDSVAEEVLGKLYHSLAALWNIMNANKLVIRGHKGSRFASLRWHPFFYLLSSVSLIQCTKYEILPPLSQLNFLKELFVEGASSLESFMQNGDDIPEEGWQETQARIAFPRLQKLEFHNMPVWKEWLGTKEGDFPLLRKLILKHCPRLMALPHLPPSLEELELEACHELTSLFDSPYHTKSFISFNPLRWLSLSATEGTPPILQHMSLTNCPLLLTWCEGHSRILADIPNLLIDGVQVHTRDEKGIRQ